MPKSDRRKRILYLALGWPPSHPAGSEVMGHELARALVGAGHDVIVSVSRPDYSPAEPYTLDGVQVLPFANRAQDSRRSFGCDVVIAHLCDMPRAAALARKARCPVAVVVHNFEKPPLGVDLAVYNSQWLAEWHDAAGRGDPWMVVRPPVDVPAYRTTPGDLVTLVNAKIDKGGLLVKGLAKRLPDIGFLVVQGAYGAQVPMRAKNITRQKLVAPTEMRDKVYSRTRVLLMPSAHESWGRVAVEAMASGIPVIAHPTPGLKECLGPAGIYADRDDPSAWEAAITRLGDGRAYAAASKKAAARADELHRMTTADLEAFVEAVTNLRRRHR
jgi:glycosyltransferase involved in cell wall biosynthesis